MFDVDGKIGSRYQKLYRISGGGFGEVYKAQDQLLNTPVAIKMIGPQLVDDPKIKDMLRDEAILTRKLEAHPNIIKIYDLLETADQLAIVMEYIDGIDLDRFIRNCQATEGYVRSKIALHIIAEVCQALEHAHNAKDKSTGAPLKIVHRDVSPANTMITFEGEVKVIDFGIAKAEFVARQAPRTSTGLLKGKIPYMTPEHGSSKMDRRSDLYALGAVLYETLTGAKLFDNPDLSQQLLDAQHANILPAKFESDRITPQIERIIKKAVEREAHKRYQSAQAMYEDLEALLQRFGDRRADLQRELSKIMSKFRVNAPEETVVEALPPTKELPIEDKSSGPTVTIVADGPTVKPTLDDKKDEAQRSVPPEPKPATPVNNKKRFPALAPRNIIATAIGLALLTFAISRFFVTAAIVPTVKFQITSNLDGALILVDGQSRGNTPAEFVAKRDTFFALALCYNRFDTVKGFYYRGNETFEAVDTAGWQHSKPPGAAVWLVKGNFSKNVYFKTTPARNVQAQILVDNVPLGFANQDDSIRLFAGLRQITLRLNSKTYLDSSFALSVDPELGNIVTIPLRPRVISPPPIRRLLVRAIDAETKAEVRAFVVKGGRLLSTPLELQNPTPSIKVVALGYLDKVQEISPDLTGEVVIDLKRQSAEGVKITVKDKKTGAPILDGMIRFCKDNRMEDCRKEGEGFVGEPFGELNAFGSHSRPLKSGKYFFKIDFGQKSKYKLCVPPDAIQVQNGNEIVFEIVGKKESCSWMIR